MKLQELIQNKEAFTKFVKEVWPIIFPKKPLTDEKLNEILNDKQTQEMALKANRVLEEQKKYKAKENELKEKYGKTRIDKANGKEIKYLDTGDLDRSFRLHLKLDGSAESEEFNRKYIEHITSPETQHQAHLETIADLVNLDKTKIMPESPEEAFDIALNPEVNQYTEDAFNIYHISDGVGPKIREIAFRQRDVFEKVKIRSAAEVFANPLFLFAKDFDFTNDLQKINQNALKDYAMAPENKELFENYIINGSINLIQQLSNLDFNNREFAKNKARKEYIRNNHLDPTLKTLRFTQNGKPVNALEGLDGLIAGDKSFEVTSVAPEVADEEIKTGIEQSEKIHNYFKEMQNAYKLGKTKDENKVETILPAAIGMNLAKTMAEHLIEVTYDKLTLENIKDITGVFQGLDFRNSVLIRGVENLKNFKGELPSDIKAIYDKHNLKDCKPTEIQAIMKFAMTNPEASALMLEGIKDKFITSIGNAFDFENSKNFTALNAVFIKAGIDLNDKNLFVKGSEIKTFFNDVTKQQIYVNQETIDDLKQSHPEMTEILNQANEITANGNEFATNVRASVEKEVGTYNDRSLFFDTKKNFAQYSDIIGPSNAFDYYKDLDKSENIISDLNNTTEAFSEENKAKLLDIYNYMDKAGILPTGNIHGEDANKVYGFAKLAASINQVKEAVNSKDVNQIKIAVENYNKTDEMMKGIFEKLDTLGNERFGANIAATRNGGFPPFYRNNYVKTSQMNQFWMIGNLSKETGIPFKEMLDHPMESMAKIYKYQYEHGAETEYVKNHSQVELIKDFIEYADGGSELNSKVLKDIENQRTKLVRAMDGLALFCDNEKLRNEIALKVDLYFINSNKELYQNTADKETFMNYLTVEKEDVDIRKLGHGAENTINLITCKKNEKFSPEAYMASGKTTMAKLAQRLVDCDEMELNNSELDEAIKGVASMALKEKSFAASDYLKNTMQKIADGQVSELSPGDKMMIKAELSLNAGMDQKDLASSVASLSDVQKEYNSRNFILKLLGPKTRKMAAMLESSKQQLSQKFGVSVEKLNEHFKNPSVSLKDEVKENKPEEVKTDVMIEHANQPVKRQALDLADPEFSAQIDEAVNGADRKMVITSMDELSDPDKSFEVDKDAVDFSNQL